MENDFYKSYDEELGIDEYIKRTKLSNNQFAEIRFQEYYYKGNFVEYNITFVIGNKKKKLNVDMMEHSTTGKIGLEGLIWAKKQILLFEEYIFKIFPIEEFPNEKVYLTVRWADNRRRNVYARGLKNIGYEFKHFGGGKCLIKQLTKE